MITLLLGSPAQTRALARILAGLLTPPAIVTVAGELGSGKTTLVREVLRARGVRGVITSPSFTLAQSYHGAAGEDLHHLDLYRLAKGTDVDLFSWDDYVGPRALTLVEWPAVAADVLPSPAVCVELEHRTVRSRVARLSATRRLEEVVLERALAAGIRAFAEESS